MVQVKKTAVREAILDAALRLFRRKGYVETTLNEIAGEASVSRANIYVYFHSKFDLFYAVFEPWLERRLEILENELGQINDPRAKLQRILVALWREIPREGNGFANNLMQALSTATSDEGYSPAFLRSVEKRVADMIDACVPDCRTRVDSRAFAQLAFMAFDGFAMHAHLKTGDPCRDAVIETVCELVFTPAAELPREARTQAGPQLRKRTPTLARGRKLRSNSSRLDAHRSE